MFGLGEAETGADLRFLLWNFVKRWIVAENFGHPDCRLDLKAFGH